MLNNELLKTLKKTDSIFNPKNFLIPTSYWLRIAKVIEGNPIKVPSFILDNLNIDLYLFDVNYYKEEITLNKDSFLYYEEVVDDIYHILLACEEKCGVYNY